MKISEEYRTPAIGIILGCLTAFAVFSHAPVPCSDAPVDKMLAQAGLGILSVPVLGNQEIAMAAIGLGTALITLSMWKTAKVI